VIIGSSKSIGACPAARHVDHPWRSRLARQQEARQIVDLKAQLEPIRALLATVTEADPGVVDEHVDRRQRDGHLTHGRERSEVGEEQLGCPGLIEGAATAFGVAAVDQDGVSSLHQFTRERPAEAVGGAGHEDGGHRLTG
jgi:hypothetical protein